MLQDALSARTSLVHLFLFALAVQVAFILLTHAIGVTSPFMPDAQTQRVGARRVAEYWAEHGLPSPSEMRTILGGNVWGVEFYQATIYRLLGTSWLWTRLGFAVGAAISPVAAYVLARRFATDPRVPRRAFLVVAFWPTTIFWTVAGLKDGFLAGVALGIVAAVATLPIVSGAIVGLGGAWVTSLFRPVLAGALAVATLVGLLIRVAAESLSGRRLARGLVSALVLVVAIGAVILGPRAAELAESASTLEYADERGTHTIFEGGLVTRTVEAFRPDVLAKGLLSPLPWKWEPQLASPHRWLYPGMVVWVIALPVMGLSAWHLVKARSASALVLLAFVGSYMAGYYFTFAGEFTRQRSIVEPAGTLLAVVAWSRWPERSTTFAAAGAVFVGALAIGHVLLTAS